MSCYEVGSARPEVATILRRFKFGVRFMFYVAKHGLCADLKFESFCIYREIMKKEITQQKLRELFEYKKGMLFWKVRMNRRKGGI